MPRLRLAMLPPATQLPYCIGRLESSLARKAMQQPRPHECMQGGSPAIRAECCPGGSVATVLVQTSAARAPSIALRCSYAVPQQAMLTIVLLLFNRTLCSSNLAIQ